MYPINRHLPSVKKVHQRTDAVGKVYVPAGEQSWWELDEADLTEREQALLALLSEQAPSGTQHPWLHYLTEQAPLPTTVEKVQFVHIHIWKAPQDEESQRGWLEMMKALLPMQVAVVSMSASDYLVVLEQRQFVDVYELLTESLAALELDFGVKLTCFVGQIWSECSEEALRKVYREERDLVESWLRQFQKAMVLSFPQLFLWGQAGGSLKLTAIRQELKHLIETQDMQDIILALWQEGAVATKAAQRLYIHRNTLQYRLEKWHELTGLQLRDLTDLAFCHSLVLEDTF